MDDLLFSPPACAVLPVQGEARGYPVRNVYGVTRNYDPGGVIRAQGERPLPAIFTKSALWIATSGATIPYPPASQRLEPEIEMILAIGTAVRDVDPRHAAAAIFGYGVGLDMTRRDLQHEARAKRDPLDIAKWFEGATPVSALARAAAIGHPASGAITLDVNGVRVQSGDLGDMIWRPAEIVAMLSHFVPLYPGDIIFTGTPPGEIALRPGDRLTGAIAGIGTLDLTLAPALS